MNIIEAVHSGNPFKRKDKLIWFHQRWEVQINTEDILALDWEIKSEPITKEKMNEAILLLESRLTATLPHQWGNAFAAFKKELGLP